MSEIAVRYLWLAAGWSAMVLGLIGVVVPGLPTTPFLLLAAFAFSKSAPRLKLWLETHPRFGPPIRDWEERGAISVRAKTLAISTMLILLALSLVLGLSPKLIAVQALFMGVGALFILTRPS